MNKKVALVTGGTSGIGKAIVKELLSLNYNVVTCYHQNDDAAEQTERELKSPNLLILKCDVTKEKDVIDMMNIIKSKYGKVDALVNNAGANIDGWIKTFDMENYKKVLDTNLIGKVICTKYVYSLMPEYGSIVNISSHLGVSPCQESSAYCAAAAAIINFTKASALEYAEKKIRVNCICPSFTKSPLSLKGWTEEEIQKKLMNTPLGRLATPEDTAKLCAFLLSEDASFISGENIWINGGNG